MKTRNSTSRATRIIHCALIASLSFVPAFARAAQAPIVDSGTGGENARVVGRVSGGGFSAAVNVRSFKFGTTIAGSFAGVAAKPVLSDLTLVKAMDANSVTLFASLVSGTHFPTVTLEVFAPGGTNVLFKFELGEVTLAGLTQGDRGRQNGGQPLEEVTFSYRRIQTTAGSVTTCYDIASASRC